MNRADQLRERVRPVLTASSLWVLPGACNTRTALAERSLRSTPCQVPATTSRSGGVHSNRDSVKATWSWTAIRGFTFTQKR